MIALLTAALVTASCGALPAQLSAIARAADGRVGASLKLLETGETFALREHEAFLSQSTYKLPIAMAALEKAAAQKTPFSAKIRLSSQDVVDGPFPSRALYRKGVRAIPLSALVDYAIGVSDNTASDALLRYAGGAAAVNAYVAGLGVRGLTVGTGIRAFVPGKNLATPAGMVSLLEALHRSPKVSPATRKLVLDAMRRTSTGPGRIKGLLPAQAVVAHKTGTSGNAGGRAAATNDVGLVTLPDGRHLAIAVYVANAPSEASAERTIAKIARAAWDCLTAR